MTNATTKRADEIKEGDHVVEGDGALLKVTMVRVHRGTAYLWLESDGVGPRKVTWYGKASKLIQVAL